MISILIPIYNQNIVKLVDELIEQCQKAKVAFEIICLDDGSQMRFRKKNQEINSRFCVNYVELTANIGRSRIRNRLCNLARYDWLLYLDCDVKPASKKFIRNYLDVLGSEASYVGGINYNRKLPKDKSKHLHWYYGHRRESRSSKRRNNNPESFFHSGNFMISRNVMLSHPFDDTEVGYGFEDIILGHEITKNGKKIIHINNPVIHKGLKEHKVFLEQQKEAVLKLARLYLDGTIRNTRLIKTHKFLLRFRLLRFFINSIHKRENNLIEGLLENPKQLIRLDLLKLYYFDKGLKGLKIKRNQ